MDRATNKDGQAIVINMAPDVCLTPMGAAMVPVPYNITSQFDIAVITSSNVNYGGLPAFTMASRLPTVKGDEPGVGGGVVSGVNLGFCKPIQHASTYRVNGQWVVRHGDQMEMNCAGPDGAGNTVGQIIYAGMGPVPHIDDGDPPDDDVTDEDIENDEEYKKALEEEKKLQEELDATKKEIALLAIETGLDVAGIFDPTPTSDTAAAGMAVARGDYLGALGNVIGWVPYLGDVVGKPLKGWRTSKAALRLGEKLKKLAAKLEKMKDFLKGLKDKIKKKLSGKNKPDKPKDKGNGGHIPPREVNFSDKQLQKKFKHAKDFGVNDNWSRAAGEKFKEAMQKHLKDPNTKQIQGTYNGQPVTHSYNPNTGLNVMSDGSGNFISGWKLSPAQQGFMGSTGAIGGH